MTNFIERYYLDESDLYICDDVIQFFKDQKHHHINGRVLKDNAEQVNKEVKDSTDIQREFDFFDSEPSTKKLLNFLWTSVEQYAKKYDELWDSNWRIRPLLKLQHYEPPNGGFKQFHCERNNALHNVCFVWMFYLNTVNDGGGTEFKYQECIEKAEKGKLLLWPSDFTHTHRGIPSPSEEKYIFTGWYEFT